MEEEKILETVEKYSDTVLRLAFSYMKSREDAEDIVQEVFIKLIEKGGRFENSEHEKAWLLRVAINMCKNKLKRRGLKRMEPLSDTIASDDGVFCGSVVTDAVMNLNAQQRTIIHLYYYEGYKTPEIAEILHMRESSVRSSLYRARQNLKIMLKEEYDFE